MFPVTLTLTEAAQSEAVAPSGIGDVLKSLVLNMVANPIKSISEANYIGVLTWAVIFGLALKKLAGDKTKCILSDISNAVTKSVHWVINLAPFGIMGLVFRCFKESGLTAFFTRSSAANIPINMALCERLGLNRDVYSVSIPLGATINMDGAAITITVMTLAAANTVGITVDIPTALVLSVLAALAACGSSGVAGGSLLLIPMACSLFNISNDIAMQVVAIGFIIGVVQDSFETAINSSGDVLFAATSKFMQWRKEGKEIKF